MRDCLFFIPSRERARWLMKQRHHTLKYLWSLNPVLYVRHDDSELDLYREYAKHYDTEVIVFDSKGIDYCSQTYDSIIDRAIGLGFQYLIVFDDDLHFKTHNPIKNAKPLFIDPSPEVMRSFFNQVRGV